MVLHARVVLDLCEKLEEEISFRQVEGDFDFFHGKWTLEQLGSHHTLLKYVVKTKMHRNSFLSEAIMEEVIYEDLPSNLCAIRDYVENNISDSEFSNELLKPSFETEYDFKSDDLISSDCTRPSFSRQRPRVVGLQTDIEVLKSELMKFIDKHGQEGFMPMRKQLRKHGRVDIEKAITRMGGFRKLSSLMNLSLAYKQRKPKGYWDSLENLKEEINGFQRSWGMDTTFMPSRKSFERAGRYDIARALEKWGGLHEVSRLLSLNVRHPNRKLRQPKEKSDPVISVVAAVNRLQTPSKLGVSNNSESWVTELKDFDINWVD